MSRTRQTGPVVGPYVTFRLIARAALGSGQASTVLDRMPIPADFRIDHVVFSALGITANATAAITNSGGNAGTGTVDIDAASNIDVNASVFASTSSGFRDVPRGNALELRGTTDGTGAIPAAGLQALVTGHFMDHVTINKFRDSGQSKNSGPVAGYYDVLTFTNLRQNANQAARAECGITAPYACRAMAIVFHTVGQTEGTGTITAQLKNITKGTNFHNALDVDALGADATNGDVGRIDPATATVLSNRDIARGDVLEMHVATGAADVVPIGALTANLIVWVQDHVNLDGTFKQVFPNDHPGKVTGPALGNMLAIPFVNKRLAQAAVRTEDKFFLPFDGKLVSVVSCKAANDATTRYVDVRGSAAIPILSAQNAIWHAEGSGIANFTNSAMVSAPLRAGEDSALLYASFLDSFSWRLTGAAAAVFAVTGHALFAMRSHIGGNTTDPAVMN